MHCLRGIIYRVITFLYIGSFCNPVFAQEASGGNSTVPIFATELSTAKKLLDMVIEFCVKYSFQVLGGIIVLILGFIVAKIVARFLGRFLDSKKVDVTVAKFLIGIVKLTIILFAALIALGNFVFRVGKPVKKPDFVSPLTYITETAYPQSMFYPSMSPEINQVSGGFCGYCGKPLLPDAQYCGYCGSKHVPQGIQEEKDEISY